MSVWTGSACRCLFRGAPTGGAYQRAGNGLFALGYKGLLAPSAARPEDLRIEEKATPARPRSSIGASVALHEPDCTSL
ncbi:MAG: hypothetical protein ACHQHO_12990 [Solirubrobacterales bacterium]